MNQTDNKLQEIRLLSTRLGVLTGVLLVLGLVLAGHAFAAYEEVGIFSGSLTPPAEPGVFPEEVQLGGVGGMAVNVNGAGGVAPGTAYAVLDSFESVRVSRFEPEPDGKLKFVEAWEVAHGEGAYERCGPVLHTSCPTQAKNGSSGFVDVGVDQATGNVYVDSRAGGVQPKAFAIIEYNSDGSKVVSRFGEFAAGVETTAASPEKIHAAASGIAVDTSGDVYVFDRNFHEEYHRLMEFVPQSPGDYEHYVYAGQNHDVGGGLSREGHEPTESALDSAGDIYVASEPGYVEEYAQGVGGSFSLVCSFHDPHGGITAMAVDPDSKEVFYYSYKNKEIHRLNACNEKGEFVEAESFGVSPERDWIDALAFDPVRRFAPSRAPGVLYGAAPGPVPKTGGKGEPGQSALGYMFAQVEENPPVVGAESVSGVTSTSGELHAQIYPRGSDTHYVFQYITDAAFKEDGESFTGAVEVPLGGADVGNSQGAHSLGVSLSGLIPDTAYRYRVIATSNCSLSEPAKVCEGVGVVQGFHTFPVEAAGLSDGRAYELVSPIDKNGGQVFPSEPGVSSCVFRECKPGGAYTRFPRQSTADGEAIVYEGSPFSSGGGAIIENEYLSRRTSAGWQTTNLTPASLASKGHGGYEAFDPSLSRALLEQRAPSLSAGAPDGYPDYYLQPTGDPASFAPLMSDTPLNHSPFNRVPGNALGSLAIRYAGASSDLSRVFFAANDALAGEATGGAEESINLYEWAGGALRSVNLLPGQSNTTPGALFGWEAGQETDLSHAISDDGSRVFWSSGSGQVYVREGGEQTVEIPDHTGRFLTAAADGSRVLLSDGHLFSVGGEELPVDLTQGKNGFDGLVGQSDDLSSVYFVDTEVLSEAANDQGAKAQTGKDNLYYWHEGALVFVASLLSTGATTDTRDWESLPHRTAEASPDGEWVAFLSHASLTGYNNVGKCESINQTEEFRDAPCPEVFLYDAATGKLSCASCDPSGAAPLGPATFTVLGGGNGAFQQPRYLIDTGRLYFDTRDSLTPGDTNHGVEDVYQYEPGGIGTCVRNGGCVSLISGGTGTADSNFLTMDTTGKNVFFTTRDRLVNGDHDELVDLYDAREGGAAATEPGAKGCAGETCQGPPSSPLFESAPGSFVFSGAGNLIAPRSGSVTAKPKARTLTRAQVLARALRACKSKPKKKRAACERTARKKYATKASAKRATSNRKAGR